jgi:hypothetical protein
LNIQENVQQQPNAEQAASDGDDALGRPEGKVDDPHGVILGDPCIPGQPAALPRYDHKQHQPGQVAENVEKVLAPLRQPSSRHLDLDVLLQGLDVSDAQVNHPHHHELG